MLKGHLRTLRWGALVPIFAIVSCGNRHRIYEGLIKTREVYKLSSVMPACGCATIASTATAGSVVRVVARLDGRDVGRMELNKTESGTQNKTKRFGFDWAGTGDTQHYEIAAYDEKGQVLLPIADYVYISPPVDISCGTPPLDCPMAALGMTAAVTSESAVRAVEGNERGAIYESNGTQITLAASLHDSSAEQANPSDTSPRSVTDTGRPALGANGSPTGVVTPPAPDPVLTHLLGDCGCVLLRTGNAPGDIDITLSGTAVGHLRLDKGKDVAVAFDWAGPQPLDHYVLSVRSGKIRDYVTIVGQLDKMACLKDHSGAEMIVDGVGPLKCHFRDDANMCSAVGCPGKESAPR